MKHHTKDPSKRAEHIAEHYANNRSFDLRESMEPDWTEFWLNTYYSARHELAEDHETQANEK